MFDLVFEEPARGPYQPEPASGYRTFRAETETFRAWYNEQGDAGIGTFRKPGHAHEDLVTHKTVHMTTVSAALAWIQDQFQRHERGEI